MSEINLTPTASTSIATPTSNVFAVFADSDKYLKTKDDTGYIRGNILNVSTAAQSLTAGVRTYITGSRIAVPKGKLQIGTIFKWTFDITKTAAGTASSTYDIAVGTSGTTSDTARITFTKPAGTAAADNGRITIEAIVRGPLSSAGVIAAHFNLTHNLLNTGHAVIPCVDITTISAGFDITVPNLFVGICANIGASEAITIQMVMAEANNL